MKEAISVNFQNPAFRPIESQGTASGFCESKQKKNRTNGLYLQFTCSYIKNKKRKKKNIDNNEEFDPGSG